MHGQQKYCPSDVTVHQTGNSSNGCHPWIFHSVMDFKGNSLDRYIAGNFQEKFPNKNPFQESEARAIYHYTSVDVFERMLHKDADFYLSECSLLNDDKEFFTGLELLFKHQEKSGHDLFWGLDQDYIAKKIKNPSEEPWIMCFSSESDSLGQWISYTDRQKGGVAIGFDIDKLFLSLNHAYASWRDVDNRYGSLIYLVPCFYAERDESSISKLIDFMFGEYREQMLSFYDAEDDIAQHSVTFELILIFSSMIKHESFHGEKEWRIVFLPHSEDRTAQYQFLGGKPRLKSHMFDDKNMLRDAIVDVMISPHGSGTRPVASLLKLSGRYSLNPRHSKSPYNGM